MPYLREDELAELHHSIRRLERVRDAAEVLSEAMVESEVKGANYDAVDEPWQHLTAALVNAGSSFVPVATVRVDR